MKIKPIAIIEHYDLDDAATEIFAHSLVTFGANDGIEPVVGTEGVVPVLYARKNLKDGGNNVQYDQQGQNPQGEAMSGVIALLDATGMTVADVGATVYADDDHTVSKDAAGTGRPVVGRVTKFVSATEVFVYIPGLLEAPAEDASA